MVAELSPILSDTTPGLARRARLGDRFQYWRGRSGTRYVFSAVPFNALADFRSALAILAEPTRDGRFMAWTAADIDSAGWLHPHDSAWPDEAPPGSIAFVHFLAESDGERDEAITDLMGYEPAPEFNLAA